VNYDEKMSKILTLEQNTTNNKFFTLWSWKFFFEIDGSAAGFSFTQQKKSLPCSTYGSVFPAENGVKSWE
jgi:hypothetical protein